MMKTPEHDPAPLASAPNPPLAPATVRALRARAHALKPVVRIAASGPTEGMLRELDRALDAHELVKIHAAADDREERARLLVALCEQLGAQPVQTIGKMLVAYRQRPQGDETPQRPPERSRAVNARRKRTVNARGSAGGPKARTRKSAAKSGARSRRG